MGVCLICCKATDWLRGICSSCKRFHFKGASIVQIRKIVGVSCSVSSIRYILSTFCAADRVD